MMNVDQITSRLAKLPDQALQQYAAMHKNDPYIMALAVAESNRRKEMRQAAQGAQGEMPKVVDEELAQMGAPVMLPEDSGIARLPAGDMNFADGGIVAFANGGSPTSMPDYSTVPSYMAAAGVPIAVYRQAADLAARLGTTVPEVLKTMGYDLAAASGRGAAQVGRAAMTAPGAAILAGGIPATQFATDTMAASPQLRAAYVDNPMLGAMDPNGALAAAILDQARPGESVAQTRPAPKTPAAATQTGPSAEALAQGRAPMTAPMSETSTYTRSGDPGPGRRAAAAARDTNAPIERETNAPGAVAPTRPTAGGFDMTPQGLMALRKKLGEDVTVEEPAGLKAAREALTAEEVQAARDRKTAIERDQAKFADAFKGREERLSKREGEIGKQRNENTGLAFLNAGLAIMSTPGSLATAIGKGARVGTEQYAAGLDKLRAAQDKLDEARDRLDDLKLNRDTMNAKEIREAEAGIQAATIEGKKRGVAALEKMFDVSNKRADTMFGTIAETGLTVFREQQANARNAATVAASKRNTQLDIIKALQGDPKLLETYQAMHGDKGGIMSEYTKWLKENPQYMANPEAGLKAFVQAKGALSTISGRTSVSDKPTGPVLD